jgi:hypothetical protein
MPPKASQFEWPADARFLIPGVNDTWNCFQKFCRGKVVTPMQWKVAKSELFSQYAATTGSNLNLW